jgi:hypothetical protein
MVRRSALCLYSVLVLCEMVPLPAPAAPSGSNAVTTNEAACITPSGIDAHCYGDTGDGSTDDTAALDRAVSAALAADQPLFLPHGTYKLTRPLVIDYRTRSDTGFRVISMGAILDGKTIADQPVLEIECSGGTSISPKGCFYFDEQGTLLVNARSDSYAVVIGQRDFSDAQNSIKIDHLIVNNAGAGSRAGGLQLNYVLNAEIFAVADSAGGAAGIALEQTQISRISGAGSAAARGGSALRIENGYSFANTIDAMDLEVAPICLVIDSRNAAHNTFISPYMACPTAVDASAGSTTRLVNPLFAGNVKTEFAAAVGITTGP